YPLPEHLRDRRYETSLGGASLFWRLGREELLELLLIDVLVEAAHSIPHFGSGNQLPHRGLPKDRECLPDHQRAFVLHRLLDLAAAYFREQSLERGARPWPGSKQGGAH